MSRPGGSQRRSRWWEADGEARPSPLHTGERPGRVRPDRVLTTIPRPPTLQITSAARRRRPRFVVAVVAAALVSTMTVVAVVGVLTHFRFDTPTVGSPRDIAAVSADPCRALPPNALGRLGLRDRGQSTWSAVYGDPQCSWSTPLDAEYVSTWIQVSPGRDDFGRRYRFSTDAVSELEWVSGLPTLVQQEEVSDTRCQVTAAVGDGDAVTVSVVADAGPCERARAVAREVVDRLPRR